MDIDLKVTYDYFRVPEQTAMTERTRGKPVNAFPYMRSRPSFKPYPKGGGVKCKLWLNGRVIAEAWSVCSMSDNFCYRTGRAIALGRAKEKVL